LLSSELAAAGSARSMGRRQACFPKTRRGKEQNVLRYLLMLLAAAVVGAAVAVTAFARGGAQVQPPASIAKAGKIVFCSDVTYPPEEYYKGSTAIGSDVDIAAGVAKLMGVKSQIKNTTFDSIIAALLTKKCDAIISGMNDTPARRKSVDFVDYLKVGQAVTVKKGNPEHFTTLASLSGKRVSVESGTTNRDFLAASSKKLAKQGKKPITIVTFPKDTDAFAALVAGRVDAYFADAPPAAYYAKQNPKVQVCCHPINPIPIGIAIPKHDPLRAATQKAVNRLYASGQMKRIVAKWGMASAVVLLK
jgi:polar amino acid transport system substrate-binding protein